MNAFYLKIASVTQAIIKDDSFMAILNMQNEIKAINSLRHRRDVLRTTLEPWDRAISDIQDSLSTIRQVVETGLSIRHVLTLKSPTGISFRRGIFTGLDGRDPIDTESSHLLSLVDRTLNDAKETFDAVRTSVALYESQQGISLASSMALLTELVFVFIPLSFSTSIFGMEMKVCLSNFVKK